MTQPPSAPTRKILFVDGEPMLRDLYVEEARRAGLSPVVAADALQAWQTFAREQPDVVVTDLDLPGKLSGAQLIAKVRSTPLGAVIPVVAVSPGKRAIRGVTDAVILHDVDDFMRKPVPSERLMWRINELIEGRPIGVVRADGTAVSGAERAVTLDRSTDFLQGRLEEVDVATLFFSYFATGRTGKLCVMEGREVIQVWFRRGWPLFAESNIEGMGFGDWLVARGRIDRATLEEATQEWESVGRGLGVLLVARGALGARALFDEMRDNVETVLRRLFSWSAGTFYIEYQQTHEGFELPEAVSLQRSPAHHVVTGIKENYSRDRCLEILSSAQGQLAASGAAHFILRELEDSYYFENVLASLGEGATPEQLARMYPFDRDDDALRALTALWVVGGVNERIQGEVVTESKQSAAERRAERVRRAVASIKSTEHPDAKAAREARIRDRLTKRRKKRRKSGVKSIMSALDQVSAEVSFDNGVRLLKQRQFEEAIRALEEAVRLAPERAAYYSVLAQAYLGQDAVGPAELDRTLKLLKKGAALDPRNGEPYHWLGLTLVRMGHREEARITLRRSIELGSPYVEHSRTVLESLG